MKIAFFKKSWLHFILLALSIIHIFIIGLVENKTLSILLYSTSITLIFIVSYISIAEKNNKRFYLPILAVIVWWIAEFFGMPILLKLAAFTTFVFFIFIIIKLITHVAVSKEVSVIEFTESINAYLLFGIAGSMIFLTIYKNQNSAFLMTSPTENQFADFIYFTFVTLSTLGYGDITPVSPIARSIAIFFSVSGQLYMGMIVAVLVGKYLSKKS